MGLLCKNVETTVEQEIDVRRVEFNADQVEAAAEQLNEVFCHPPPLHPLACST